MRQRTGYTNLFFKVHLEKIVPMQAGLGGGSGNAATAMFAFNRFIGYRASMNELLSWSGEVGSDASFFFSGGTALCTGRGEVVHSVPRLPDANHLAVHVFKPLAGLSTASVFQALDLSRLSSRDPTELLRGFQETGVLRALGSQLLVNDLETPAFLLCPQLGLLKDELSKLPAQYGVQGAMMSGSGTSIFALTDSRVGSLPLPTQSLLQAFPGTKHYACSFINRPDDPTVWYCE